MRHVALSSRQLRSRYVVLGLLALSLVSTSCISARRTPDLEQIFASARTHTNKRPVIVIPGILGSELINSKTGETVWPSAFRTSNDVLPINPNLESNRDDLVPGKILETVRLARILPEVYVYRDLLEALRRYGVASISMTPALLEEVALGYGFDSARSFPLTVECDDMNMLADLVAQSDVLGLLPEGLARTHALSLRRLELTGVTPVVVNVHAVWLKGRTMSPAATRAVQLARQIGGQHSD